MHIAFFVPDLRGGGAQKMLINMANAFASRGHRVDLVVATQVEAFYGSISSSARIIDLKARRTILSVFALSNYIKREQPDIVLSALSHANTALILAKILSAVSRTKTIVTERNFFSERVANTTILEKITAPFFVKALYPRADRVIGISKGVADDISKVACLSPEKTLWIHNPVVSSEMVAQMPSVPVPAKNDPPVIVTAGRIVEQKDHRTLIKAFALLREERAAMLVIYGWGPLKEELQALAATLGVYDSVLFKDFVQNPLRAISGADLFVISSRWEGFCNVIVEAMFCGVPVVSTDCPAGPAEILEDGTYGALVPVGDICALVNAMRLALDGERPAPEFLRKRAMDFSVDVVCDRYESVMKEVMAS